MKKLKQPKSGSRTYRSLLLAKRKDVLAGMGAKFHTLAGMGRVAEEDQAPLSHDEFVSLRLNSLDWVQLRLVDEALDRLQSGDYGTCLECEQPIAPKRLAVLPWARYCLDCQERIGNQGDTEMIPFRPRTGPYTQS